MGKKANHLKTQKDYMTSESQMEYKCIWTAEFLIPKPVSTGAGGFWFPQR